MGEGMCTADGMSETVIAADLVVLVVGVLQGTFAWMLIDNQFLPCHHRQIYRTRRGHRHLLQYVQQKHNLFDVAMTHIDWMSQARAIRHFTDHKAPSSLNISANGFLLKNKFIVTIQQHTRAKVRHVPV
jgi:hypothetical protein